MPTEYDYNRECDYMEEYWDEDHRRAKKSSTLRIFCLGAIINFMVMVLLMLIVLAQHGPDMQKDLVWIYISALWTHVLLGMTHIIITKFNGGKTNGKR